MRNVVQDPHRAIVLGVGSEEGGHRPLPPGIQENVDYRAKPFRGENIFPYMR